MKKIKIKEEWCLGCHLCEYNCTFANMKGQKNDFLDMAKLMKGQPLQARVRIEDAENDIHFAVACRHCNDPICVKSCIAGAISKGDDGVVRINRNKCVGCQTCVLVCPFGALHPSAEGTMTKCELCLQNGFGVPACVEGCPNRAIVIEEV